MVRKLKERAKIIRRYLTIPQRRITITNFVDE
jgi:hypothetical protein